jgi:serine/threonine protein kinase
MLEERRGEWVAASPMSGSSRREPGPAVGLLAALAEPDISATNAITCALDVDARSTDDDPLRSSGTIADATLPVGEREAVTDPPDRRGRRSGPAFDGRQLGHYTLIDEIGRGGMGVVYAAQDQKLGRKVAIKMLETEGDARLQRRLVQEAKAMAKLTHPNVVSVYEIGESEGVTFIVMEFVEGTTVRAWLSARRRTVSEILATFAFAGRGLAAIHEAGLVHRDFKPDNLMIRPSGQVLVMDLGIARSEVSSRPTSVELEQGISSPLDLTRTGALMGSPGYMAPEQFVGGEVSAKTDQFSFCIALWEALHGERPFDANNLAALVDAVTSGRKRVGKRSEIPNAVQRVLERGLEVDPARRFDSMPALIDALERGASGRASAWPRLVLGAGLLASLGLVAIGVRSQFVDDEAPVVSETSEPTEPVPPKLDAGPRRITTSGLASTPALSPDGKQLVYVDDHHIVHVDLTSGETHELAAKVERVFTIRLANDGSMLVSGRLDDQHGLYRIPGLTGTPIAIFGGPLFCHLATRELIASFYLPSKAVRLTHDDGSDGTVAELPVAGEYEWLREAACDPRGEHIAVLHSLGPTHALELLTLDGKSQRVLVESATNLWSPRFDASGQTLYYLADADGQINLEATPVTPDRDGLAISRIVLPDLEASTFSRADDGRLAYARQQASWSLWRLPAGATTLDQGRVIVDADADRLNFAISPDETELAYTESKRNMGRLMIRSLVDESSRELTRGNLLDDLVWSPDGKTLAYLARYRGEFRVWTIPIEGGTPTPLRETLASETGELVWPTLDQLLYRVPGNRNFRVRDTQTGAERSLISDESAGWAFELQTSPDAKTIALFWNRAQRGLWTVGLDDGAEHLVAEGEYFPVGWSTDGHTILVAEVVDDRIDFQRVAASGGKPEPWRTLEIGPGRKAECDVLSSETLICQVVHTSSDIWIVDAVE